MLSKKDGKKKKKRKTFLSVFFQVLSSSAASSTITALSPGGALMQGGTQQAINRMCWDTFYGCPFTEISSKKQVEGRAKVYLFFFEHLWDFCLVFMHPDPETYLDDNLDFRIVLILQTVAY